MKIYSTSMALILMVLCLLSCKRSQDNMIVYNEIYKNLDQGNFFKARSLYELNGKNLSHVHQQITEAFLSNAFNRLNESETKIDVLMKKKKHLPDSLLFKMYKIKSNNAVRLYKYKEAKNATHEILSNYKKFLTDVEISDYENNLKIWTALENVAPQTVDNKKGAVIKIHKDKAGLNTIKIKTNSDSSDFVFDTGANFSTILESTAHQLGIKIIPANIEVAGITGTEVLTQLAVCERLTIGDIHFNNVVFLVVPDEVLTFSEIDYKIFGIIGFPVIEAFKEITLTQDGLFIVPEKESTFNEKSNLAIDELIPIIYFNGKHFTFDTGADNTLLYSMFYQENKEEIDNKYSIRKISFGGVGGDDDYDGFKIDYTFKIGEKDVTLKKISLLKDKITEDETVYGNIGQDLIQQFYSMTLNFNQMFVKFE